MKYLSLIMVAIIVALSWFLIRPTDGLSGEQYNKLQQVMTEYLVIYLKENNPAATDIQEPEVTTRILEAGRRMQANFKLTYNVPSDNNTVNKISRNGYFILTSENGQDWSAKMERIDDSFVQFAEGDALSISLSDAKAAAKEEAAEKPKEEAH